jgi:hypothetical protein
MSEIQFAKKHIRNRFSLMLIPHVSDGLWSVYENAKTICEKNGQTDQTLKTFQNLLTFIPKWDETRLLAEVERIQTAANCTYLEELLTATLITYLRAFASVQYSNTQDVEVEFERPPLPRFVHELYKECARQCWSHAYHFKTYGSTMEQQARNRKEIERILDEALDTTLDSFLPWKTIVEKYFKEPEKMVEAATAATAATAILPTKMTEEEEEEEEEPEPKKAVMFAESDDEDRPTMKVSEEACDLDIDFDDLDSESVKDLEPSSDELVLNL